MQLLFRTALNVKATPNSGQFHQKNNEQQQQQQQQSRSKEISIASLSAYRTT
jgi:hypothetical protein